MKSWILLSQVEMEDALRDAGVLWIKAVSLEMPIWN